MTIRVGDHVRTARNPFWLSVTAIADDGTAECCYGEHGQYAGIYRLDELTPTSLTVAGFTMPPMTDEDRDRFAEQREPRSERD